MRSAPWCLFTSGSHLIVGHLLFIDWHHVCACHQLNQVQSDKALQTNVHHRMRLTGCMMTPASVNASSCLPDVAKHGHVRDGSSSLVLILPLCFEVLLAAVGTSELVHRGKKDTRLGGTCD
jgi:hypothetical protein